MDNINVKLENDASGGAPAPTFSGTNAGAAAAAAMANPVVSTDMPQKLPSVAPPPMPNGAAANQHHPVAEFLYQVCTTVLERVPKRGGVKTLSCDNTSQLSSSFSLFSSQSPPLLLAAYQDAHR